MIIAPVGSSLKVSGSSIAIVAGGPRPGSTPMIVPSTTPATHIVRFPHVSATWKPCARPARMPRPLKQLSGRQQKVEPELEERVEADREAHAGHERGAMRFARHHANDEPGEERERDRESGER